MSLWPFRTAAINASSPMAPAFANVACAPGTKQARRGRSRGSKAMPYGGALVGTDWATHSSDHRLLRPSRPSCSGQDVAIDGGNQRCGHQILSICIGVKHRVLFVGGEELTHGNEV